MITMSGLPGGKPSEQMSQSGFGPETTIAGVGAALAGEMLGWLLGLNRGLLLGFTEGIIFNVGSSVTGMSSTQTLA